MDRILKGSAATISTTFYVDRTATNPAPDSATVTILREDGTTLQAATPATDTGTGKFSFTLTPAQTASLDVLTARWTGTVSGHVQTVETYAEIVGGFVCSLAQIDEALGKGGTASDYPIETVRAARDAATDAFEGETGRVFTPRYKRLSFDGRYGSDLMLPFQPLSISSGTVDGTALTSTQLADLEIYQTGRLYNPGSWTTGRNNVELKITYGHPYPPADVSRAVAVLAAHILKDGPFDDRGYGVTEEGGAVRLLTAGVQGAMFSIPEVESVARRYRVQPVMA